MADRRGINGRALARLDNFYGATPFILHFNSSDSDGTSNTDTIYNSNAPFKFRVVDAWMVASEAGATDSETIKLTDGTNDITDAVDISAIGDTDLKSFGEIDNAYHEISKGGSLKIVKAATTNVIAAEVYILCVRV